MELTTTPALPLPALDVRIRDATLADVAFVDQLQKLHSRQVGFMAKSWIEVKIGKGEVIVAEDRGGSPVGYCMGVDRYFKRDDVGIVHQMNVVPGRQRGLIGATLLKAMFDRAAYGCRLFCCWCAQDLPANKFWESMGFVALAYRVGSMKKGLRDCGTEGLRGEDTNVSPSVPYPSVPQSRSSGPRIHIFWQKRIRAGDTTTPWWFPAKTDAGVLREDRIVLPIPPGVHWSDEMPVIVRPTEAAVEVPKQKQLTGRASKRSLPQDAPTKHGPRQYDGPPAKAVPVVEQPIEKPKREKKPKVKTDPKLIEAARELRDRWLEQVDRDPSLLLPAGKYEVGRVVKALPHVVQASPHAIETKTVEAAKLIAA